jgi:hypothetical protein
MNLCVSLIELLGTPHRKMFHVRVTGMTIIPAAKPQARGPPLLGCLRMFI